MCVCLSGGSYSSSRSGGRSLKFSFRMIVGSVMQNTIRDGLWQRGQAMEN